MSITVSYKLAIISHNFPIFTRLLGNPQQKIKQLFKTPDKKYRVENSNCENYCRTEMIRKIALLFFNISVALMINFIT
jgi:hypothetical protein